MEMKHYVNLCTVAALPMSTVCYMPLTVGAEEISEPQWSN